MDNRCRGEVNRRMSTVLSQAFVLELSPTGFEELLFNLKKKVQTNKKPYKSFYCNKIKPVHTGRYCSFSA